MSIYYPKLGLRFQTIPWWHSFIVCGWREPRVLTGHHEEAHSRRSVFAINYFLTERRIYCNWMPRAPRLSPWLSAAFSVAYAVPCPGMSRNPHKRSGLDVELSKRFDITSCMRSSPVEKEGDGEMKKHELNTKSWLVTRKKSNRETLRTRFLFLCHSMNLIGAQTIFTILNYVNMFFQPL